MPKDNTVLHKIEDAIGVRGHITREELIDIFREFNPGISDNAVRNRIHQYVYRGKIAQITNTHYTKKTKDYWKPVPSEDLLNIWSIIENDFSKIQMCIWTTKWINEFTNLQAFDEMIFIESEEIVAESIYRILSDSLANVYFSPGKKEQGLS